MSKVERLPCLSEVSISLGTTLTCMAIAWMVHRAIIRTGYFSRYINITYNSRFSRLEVTILFIGLILLSIGLLTMFKESQLVELPTIDELCSKDEVDRGSDS